MAPLASVLALPSLAGTTQSLTGPGGDVDIAAVSLVQDLEELDRTPAGGLAVLAPSATQAAESYELDMATRLAGSRGIAALLFTDGRDEVPPTVTRLAGQLDVTVLVGSEPVDVARVLVDVAQELSGDPYAELERLRALMGALSSLEHDDEIGDAELVGRAGEAAGLSMALGEPPEGCVASPVIVEDEEEGSVHAGPVAAGGYAEVTALAATRLVAELVGRRRASARRATDAPIRSRSELLSEFLLGPAQAGDAGERLLERMRAADITVDGWHTAIQLELDNLAELTGGDELAAFQLLERVGRLGLQACQSASGTWHRTTTGTGLLFIRTARRQPGTETGRELGRTGDELVRHIKSRVQGVSLVCGVGDVHVGPNGLRATVAEARAALAGARTSGRLDAAVSFDQIGLQRTVIEWFSSDTARESVDLLLRPLDRLGPGKAERAIQTLRAYLDNQGSITRTANALHMHRNAVGYRINRIVETLEVDLDDPDTCLLLQLACRARSLS